MKKRLNMKNWHIALIVLIVCALSVISTYDFVKKHGKDLKGYFTGQQTEEEAEKTETEKNIIKVLGDDIDGGLGAINSVWSIYRQDLLSRIDSLYTYFTTGEITSVQITKGKGKWLFYTPSDDGKKPIEDYEGTNKYTQEELDEFAEIALEAQKKFEEKGIQLAVLFAPNKEGIYAEAMPDTYKKADKTRTDELAEALSKKGVNTVNPRESLVKEHNEKQLYYYYDTHWNQLGAYIGVRETLASFGIKTPKLSERKISESPLKGQYHYCAEDDLAKMLGLREILSDETEYQVEGTVPVDWNAFAAEQTSTISHLENKDAKEDATCFLIGDSFRTSMIPALLEQFSNVYIVHMDCYESGMMDEVSPDYVICEYVERYSGRIGSIGNFVE